VSAFFNGDIKIYDGKQKELITVSHLHEDKIDDIIYLKSESLNGNKYIVSCSMEPYPDLKISEVNAQANNVTIIS